MIKAPQPTTVIPSQPTVMSRPSPMTKVGPVKPTWSHGLQPVLTMNMTTQEMPVMLIHHLFCCKQPRHKVCIHSDNKRDTYSGTHNLMIKHERSQPSWRQEIPFLVQPTLSMKCHNHPPTPQLWEDKVAFFIVMIVVTLSIIVGIEGCCSSAFLIPTLFLQKQKKRYYFNVLLLSMKPKMYQEDKRTILCLHFFPS
jgi:hypothetical protein